MINLSTDMKNLSTVTINEYGKRIGESHPNARLSNQQVDEMLDMFESGKPIKEIAKVFSISERHARRICKFESRNQIISHRKRA